MLYGDDGEVVEQVGLEGWPGHPPDVDAALAATRHADHVRDGGGSVVMYDGDTGRPLVLLLAGAVIVLGSPT